MAQQRDLEDLDDDGQGGEQDQDGGGSQDQGDAGGKPSAGGGEADGSGGEGGGEGDGAGDLSPEEREILRTHRRQERKDARQRQRDARDRRERYVTQLEGQLREMGARLEAVEGRTAGNDLRRLDDAISAAAQEIELAKAAKTEARKAEAFDIEDEADEALYNARRKHEELTLLKRRVGEGQRLEQQRRTSGTASQPSPRVVENAQRWAGNHAWYSRTGDDEDSEIVRLVDRRMTKEGWDPSTQEYWDELDDRLKDRLPHRYNGNGRGRPRRQTTGGAAGESPGGGGSEFNLSAERVAALKEAGMWEDPKQRARMIKRYRDADAASRRGE